MCETWKARRLATVLQSAFTSQEITGDVEKIYEYLVSRFPSVLISRPGDIHGRSCSPKPDASLAEDRLE